MKLPFILSLVLATAGSAREYHVATTGNDTDPGSQSQPLRTIQAAANIALPGGTITVHAGVYRERVNPPRGGESDAKRIVYQAAPGEKVEIKGSEVVAGWSAVFSTIAGNEIHDIHMRRLFGDCEQSHALPLFHQFPFPRPRLRPQPDCRRDADRGTGQPANSVARTPLNPSAGFERSSHGRTGTGTTLPGAFMVPWFLFSIPGEKTGGRTRREPAQDTEVLDNFATGYPAWAAQGSAGTVETVAVTLGASPADGRLFVRVRAAE